VAGKIRNATALRRYFLSQGLTFYSWTSRSSPSSLARLPPVTL